MSDLNGDLSGASCESIGYQCLDVQYKDIFASIGKTILA